MPLLSGRQQPRRGQVRARLIDAVAAALEDGESYADLTVEEVTSRAGVARSSFYVHFSDRRELLLRLVEQTTAPLLADLDRIRTLTRPPDRERLRDGMRDVVAYSRANAAVLRAFNEAASYDGEVAAFRRTLQERFVSSLEERIANQRAQGRPGGPAPRAIALALVAMVAESCYLQVSADTGTSDDELAEALAVIWERGAYGRR